MKFTERVKEAERQIADMVNEAGVACRIADIEASELGVSEDDDTKGTAMISVQLDVGTLGNSMRCEVGFMVDETAIKIIYTNYMYSVEFTLDNFRMAVGFSACFA